MNDLLVAEELANELEAEVPSTLKCLERIPPELFGYKPHEKSMELGYLALLVSEIPLWISLIVNDPEIDFATFKHTEARTTRDLVNNFNANIAKARKALTSVREGQLNELFYLKSNGKELFRSPKKEQISSSINHMVHHRGQLTVYMRLNDIAVPSIYGPSADDNSYSNGNDKG